MHTAHITRRLAEAKAGDADAHREVAEYVFNEYKGRVIAFADRLSDPAVSLDDMLMTFFEGIMRSVTLADGRGDDFYHIGQRGVWAVQSEMRAMLRIMRKRDRLVRRDGEGQIVDPIEQVPEPSDHVEVVHSRLGAAQVMRVLNVTGRAREALDTILRDDLDPTEPGFNKQLAGSMGISPQRTSQIFRALREAHEGQVQL